MDRPRRLARIASLAALALGLALLSLGCGAPERGATVSQAAGTPTAAVAEETSTVEAVLASVEVVAPTPGESAASVEERILEVSTLELADLDADWRDTRSSPLGRSGLRVAEEADQASEAATADEKMANVQSLGAPNPAVPAVVARIEMALGTVANTPTPKPVVRATVTVPVPVRPTGSWVELPNVRPIPSAYYAAVHQWDPITNYYAAYYHVDPDLIRRIIYVESKGYQYAYVASTGVKGLMQVTPSWFKAGENPYDPRTNIGKGTYILRRGYDTYHTWFLAVTWYCYGPLARYGGNVPTFYAGLIFSPIIRSL